MLEHLGEHLVDLFRFLLDLSLSDRVLFQLVGDDVRRAELASDGRVAAALRQLCRLLEQARPLANSGLLSGTWWRAIGRCLRVTLRLLVKGKARV